MPVLRVARGCAAATALLALAAGCSSESTPPKPAGAGSGPTPIGKYGAPALSRLAFCDLVPEKAVTAALGGAPESDRSWDNGDQATVAGSTDVIHELGCEWTGPSGTVARAWVFARPVDAAFATDLVAEAGRRKGCEAGTPPSFGSPSLLQTCPIRGERERVRHAGLFGDTWLTCEVAGARAESLADRAGAWCVAVAESLEAR